jgi:hypothetical protein
VDSSLSNILLRLNADVAGYNLEPDRAVWLACDLLVAGLDTPALCELAGEPPTRLSRTRARRLARRFLEELGVELMTLEQADWFLGREVARRILGGAPRSSWDGETPRITERLCKYDVGVFAALKQYDADPGLFLDYVRRYLRMADDNLESLTAGS